MIRFCNVPFTTTIRRAQQLCGGHLRSP